MAGDVSQKSTADCGLTDRSQPSSLRRTRKGTMMTDNTNARACAAGGHSDESEEADAGRLALFLLLLDVSSLP